MREITDSHLKSCRTIPYDEVNLSMEEVFKLFEENEVIIRSTYMDKEYGKMPASYDTLYDALADEDRYGSIWLDTNGKTFRVHPYDEALGIMDIINVEKGSDA